MAAKAGAEALRAVCREVEAVVEAHDGIEIEATRVVGIEEVRRRKARK